MFDGLLLDDDTLSQIILRENLQDGKEILQVKSTQQDHCYKYF